VLEGGSQAIKHVAGMECTLCELKLRDAHADLVKGYRAVKAVYPTTHVSWTHRGEKEQNEAHARGASRVRWPDSKHNKPLSLAMDLFEIRPDGIASWSPLFFRACAEILRPLGVICGLDWKNFSDPPHFEVKDSSPV